MALTFAAGDYVSIPYDGTNNPAWVVGATPVMSHSVWFKTTGSSSNTGFVCKNITNSGSGHELILNLLGNTGKLSGTVDGSVAGYAIGSATVNDGKWHHAVGIFNAVSGSAQNVYVDGVLDSTFNSTAAPIVELVGVRLGKHADNFWANFVGEIADYAMFQRALTTNEITALSRGISPSKIAGGPSIWTPLRSLA
jgi:trimeric autotransporter adhesin